MSSNNRRSWATGDEYYGATSTDHDRHRNGRQGVPRSLHYRLEEDAGGMTAPWNLFEERVRTGPYRITRFPLQPYSPVRVLVLEGSTEERVNPRLRQFINESPLRIRGNWNLQGSVLPQPDQERGLTDAEFRKAMSKLRKQQYTPPPGHPKKRGFFGTRKRSSSSSSASEERNDGKQCTICLENLVRNEQVMVTPCNHTFHDDCLVPWVKGHGNCPVCRFVLCEKRGDRSASPLNDMSNYNHNNNNNNNNGVLSEEVQTAVDLVLLLRAMEEAFNWVHLST